MGQDQCGCNRNAHKCHISQFKRVAGFNCPSKDGSVSVHGHLPIDREGLVINGKEKLQVSEPRRTVSVPSNPIKVDSALVEPLSSMDRLLKRRKLRV